MKQRSQRGGMTGDIPKLKGSLHPFFVGCVVAAAAVLYLA
jgi:hypothetical protein